MRGLFFCLLCAAGAISAQPAALTLQEALRLAEQANPGLRSAEAGLHAAEGEAREASALLHNNPELSLERARRTAREPEGFDTRTREHALGVSQAFEIGGQQAHRRAAASREIAATRAEIAETRAKVRAEVEQAFFQVLVLQRRRDSEQEGVRLAEQAAAAIGKRVAAGEDSRLDGNVAAVEAEAALNRGATTVEQLADARVKLATLLQLPAERLPAVAGALGPGARTYSLQTLLDSIPLRAHLRALENREEAARSRLALERAARLPDVTVGLNTAREGTPELRERVTTLSVTLPLPLFRRNDAAIGKAMTGLDRAQIERRAAIRDSESQVRGLWQKLESLEARVRRLTESVLPRLEENVSLSTRAYRAGEIGILQLILVNRQAIDARRDYLEALDDYTQTRISLEQAAGWPSTQSTTTPAPTRSTQ